jgi:hypothetical protein
MNMNMKKTQLLVLLSLFLFSACDDVSLLSYDLDLKTAIIVIKQNADPNATIELLSGPVNPADEMDKKGVNKDLIKKSKVKSVTIKLLTPETGNFDWAKEVSVYVTADGKSEKLIATTNDVPDGIQSLTVNTENVDLVDYLQDGIFNFKVVSINDQEIPVDHEAEVSAVITVEL